MAMPFSLQFTESYAPESKQKIDATAFFVKRGEAPKHNIVLKENTEQSFVFSAPEGYRLYSELITEEAPFVQQDIRGLYVAPRSSPYVIFQFGYTKMGYPLIAGDYILTVSSPQHEVYYAQLSIQPKRLTEGQHQLLVSELERVAPGIATIRSKRTHFNQTNAQANKATNTQQQRQFIQALAMVQRNPRYIIKKHYPLGNAHQAKKFDAHSQRLQLQKPYHKGQQFYVASKRHYDIAENQLVKLWLQDLLMTLQKRQEALPLQHKLQHFLAQDWLQVVTKPRSAQLPRSLFSAGPYSTIYQLLKQQNSQEQQWLQHFKRTDDLYELWGFITIAEHIEKLGFTVQQANLQEETMYYVLQRGEQHIALYYDKIIARDPQGLTEGNPIYTLQHNRPDCRIDVWQSAKYCGSLIIDFKYRKRQYLWQEAFLHNRARVPETMLQLESYSSAMRTLPSIAASPQIAARPVTEVWALYPLKYEDYEQDYTKNLYDVRLMDLSPAMPNEHITQHLAKAITAMLAQVNV